jgi:hypothetical protein
MINQPSNEFLDFLAEARHNHNKGNSHNTPLSRDGCPYAYEFKGLVGERCFAARYDYPMELTLKPFGDGGIDFDTWEVGTVDVKTLEHFDKMLVIYSRCYSDCVQRPSSHIYVAASYKDYGIATLMGWEYSKVVHQLPHRVYPSGKDNHEVLYTDLRSMVELDELFRVARKHKSYNCLMHTSPERSGT